MTPLPCSALRVVDARLGCAGLCCGMLMAQRGAQVTKIEPPKGDGMRSMGARRGEHTALVAAGMVVLSQSSARDTARH